MAQTGRIDALGRVAVCCVPAGGSLLGRRCEGGSRDRRSSERRRMAAASVDGASSMSTLGSLDPP